MFLTGKYKDCVGQKAHCLSARRRLEITGATCVSEKLCRLKEEVGQDVSLGYSRINRVLAILSMLTVRVEALEYS